MKLLLLLGFTLFLSNAALATVSLSRSVEVKGSVDETVSKIKGFLDHKKISIMATINHSDNAINVGQKIDENVLLIFGNPNVGSKFMAENPEVGFYLPMRAQVFSKAGKTWLNISNPEFIKSHYQLKSKENQMLIAKVNGLMSGLLKAVEGK